MNRLVNKMNDDKSKIMSLKDAAFATFHPENSGGKDVKENVMSVNSGEMFY